MTNNKVTASLPTFQEAYRNAYKAYRFVIHDAGKALDQVLAGSEVSGVLIPRYLNWCQKELNSLRSEIESGMYENCQTYGLKEIEHSLQKLIEDFQKQEEIYKLIGALDYHKDIDNNHQRLDNDDMLIDDYARMSIG